MHVFRFLILFHMVIIYSACISENKKQITRGEMDQFYFFDLKNDSIYFSEIYNNKINVLFFLSPECPLCIKYTFAINQITDSFNNETISFFGIFPGKNFTNDEIYIYINKYRLDFNMILDPNYIISTYLNAKVTPEVFVLDNQGKIQYEGAIDNWIVSLGRLRQNITEFYLEDALEAMQNNKAVPVRKTKAVGCLIE